jgi:hypothetical protein
MYMEVPKGNSLCSYIKQAKTSFFFFFFSYTKIRKPEGRTGLTWGIGNCGKRGEGGEKEKEDKCVYCVHMYVNGKIISVQTITGMGEGQMKNSRGGESKYDIFNIL